EISSRQLTKNVKMTQKTAWFVLIRLRLVFGVPIRGTKLKGVVEMDETYQGVNHRKKQYASGEASVNAVENHEFVLRNNTRNYSIQDKFELILSSSIVGVKIPCGVLEDGTRVLSVPKTQEVLEKLGGSGTKRNFVELWKELLSSNTLELFTKNRKAILFCEATLLANTWEVYNSEITKPKGQSPKQRLIAEQNEMLFNSFAKVGIISLIDEATGYQQEREKEELRAFSRAYILSAGANGLISEDEKGEFIKHLKERYYSYKELGNWGKIQKTDFGKALKFLANSPPIREKDVKKKVNGVKN
ncbi:587_t:CDS:2, partial [Funneliformis geosporum]